jgi:hypothetical protein
MNSPQGPAQVSLCPICTFPFPAVCCQQRKERLRSLCLCTGICCPIPSEPSTKPSLQPARVPPNYCPGPQVSRLPVSPTHRCPAYPCRRPTGVPALPASWTRVAGRRPGLQADEPQRGGAGAPEEGGGRAGARRPRQDSPAWAGWPRTCAHPRLPPARPRGGARGSRPRASTRPGAGGASVRVRDGGAGSAPGIGVGWIPARPGTKERPAEPGAARTGAQELDAKGAAKGRTPPGGVRKPGKSGLRSPVTQGGGRK